MRSCSSGLASGTIKGAAAGLDDAADAGFTLATRLSGPAVDAQRYGKVAGAAFGVEEIPQRGAPGRNRFGEYVSQVRQQLIPSCTAQPPHRASWAHPAAVQCLARVDVAHA